MSCPNWSMTMQQARNIATAPTRQVRRVRNVIMSIYARRTSRRQWRRLGGKQTVGDHVQRGQSDLAPIAARWVSCRQTAETKQGVTIRQGMALSGLDHCNVAAVLFPDIEGWRLHRPCTNFRYVTGMGDVCAATLPGVRHLHLSGWAGLFPFLHDVAASALPSLRR
jgi:hypothetical protein